MRTYKPEECAVFCRTRDAHGGCSNMAAGFPLVVCGVAIRTSEALYQACRFPDHPDLQREVIDQKSPMAAKMVTKPHRHLTRPDWDEVKCRVMEWAVSVKLAQNFAAFSRVLADTGNRSIVERSRNDDFWGATMQDDGTLVGDNWLGVTLERLRERAASWVEHGMDVVEVEPPWKVPDFLLLGQPIPAMRHPISVRARTAHSSEPVPDPDPWACLPTSPREKS